MVSTTVIGNMRIPTDRLSGVLSRIERINEKLLSSGAPTIELEIISQGMERVEAGPSTGLAPMTILRLNRQVGDENNRVRILAVSHLNNTNDGFETHRFFDQLSDRQIEAVNNPKNSPNFCDHCETVRLRSKMYTVQIGEVISRVGTSCLDEFSGMKLMPWAKAMDAADKTLEQFSLINFNEMKSVLSVTVDSFLEEALQVIEEGDYDNLTTQEFNRVISSKAYLAAGIKIQNDDRSPAPEHVKEKVGQVKKFIQSTEIDPSKRSVDYYLNLRNVINHGYVTSIESTLLASSIRSMENDLKRQKDLESKKDIGNRFVGTVKDRVAFKNLTVESVYYKEGMYGYTTELKMRDSENNFYSWNASGYLEIDAEDVIHLVGTIKGHESWESKKYGKTIFDNQITRCKIMSEEEIDSHIEKEEKKKSRKKEKQQSTDADVAM